MKTLILGLGNPLRSDDGIGVAVVEALRPIVSFSKDVEIIDAGTSELQALLIMQEYQRVFIIDAAEMEAEPGDWRCIRIEDIVPVSEVHMNENLHKMGLNEMIALGRALHILPKEIFIYAVQPHTLQYSLGLSQSLAPAVEEVSQNILHRLGGALDICKCSNSLDQEGSN